MSLVRGKDSEIETLFRKKLWERGFRYRKNSNKYFGKPDIILPKYKTVIFIDSCFWHGCKKHCRMPSSNVRYWSHKIENNKTRDKKVNNFYRKKGWSLLRVWEHSIKSDLENCVQRVCEFLKKREDV